MHTLILLIAVTLCYAAYNLLVKVSSGHVGATSSPILATISLQLAALSVSLLYLAYMARNDFLITIPGKAYAWAIAAGFCIGLAEVLYFYLFRGVGGEKSIAAGSAIPFVVGGTIVITVLASLWLFREPLNAQQWIGVGLAFAGMTILATAST